MLIEKLKKALPKEYPKKETNAKESAVLIPFLNLNGEWVLIFEKKPSYDRLHPSQISFPGGSREESDKSFLDTAIRETCEELGINKDDIQIIGAVEPTKTLTTNFMIYPFVGVVNRRPPFKINKKEVEKLLFIPLVYLIDNSPIKYKEYKYRDRKRKTPLLEYNNEIIWGATARILNNFIPIIKKLL
ncbi:NUDIX hydrolase [Hippea maritima]|uniref:NUDIX hydrolase n=1 Tax=Hippea maritima (strain ATCC 700847 / DSM 10411 / MH2) TaxID=760142 RepID=F2LTL8_HIPMA|nr:CoA pyrophosphatase [Hippea maritima]AEA33343.1 NUDIX hydrolase [Hippea maritima DSM 10411]